jgi:hypothetical protein
MYTSMLGCLPPMDLVAYGVRVFIAANIVGQQRME